MLPPNPLVRGPFTLPLSPLFLSLSLSFSLVLFLSLSLPLLLPRFQPPHQSSKIRTHQVHLLRSFQQISMAQVQSEQSLITSTSTVWGLVWVAAVYRSVGLTWLSCDLSCDPQVTFQACDLPEARLLYDQLAVICPIMVGSDGITGSFKFCPPPIAPPSCQFQRRLL